MRLLQETHREKQMLDKLTPQQVEQAFQWLDSPVQSYPPEELKSLSEVEWFLLERMLQGLLAEKEQNRVQ